MRHTVKGLVGIQCQFAVLGMWLERSHSDIIVIVVGWWIDQINGRRDGSRSIFGKTSNVSVDGRI